jgi:hypothetical protein
MSSYLGMGLGIRIYGRLDWKLELFDQILFIERTLVVRDPLGQPLSLIEP